MKKERLAEINDMRPAEREAAQLECLKEAIIAQRRAMSIKEMSTYLKSKGFENGSSEKTIYRRILPQLEKLSVKKHHGIYDSKKSGIKYGYDPREWRTRLISRKQILWCVKTISELVRTESLKTQNLIDNFLDYQRDLLDKSDESIFYYNAQK